jgi:hypothetical protein
MAKTEAELAVRHVPHPQSLAVQSGKSGEERSQVDRGMDGGDLVLTRPLSLLLPLRDLADR